MWVKTSLAILSIYFLVSLNTPKQTIREMYAKSVESRQDAETLLSFLAKQEQSAFITGYTGATKMIMAKHALNPISKLSYFNTGKKLLDRAISKDSDNVELFFLRYATQVSAPAILGYNDNIDNDKQYILNSLANTAIKDQHLVKTITTFMKTQELTPAERQQLLKTSK